MSTPRAARVSGEKTADGAIKAAGGLLHGILLCPDGTNAVTAILYDNATAASGTILARVITPGTASDLTSFYPALPFSNGLYLDIGGVGSPRAYIYFE